MPQELPVSNVVSVDVIIEPRAAIGRSFSSLLVLGSPAVIPVSERICLYSSPEDIGTDFGVNSPKYKAATAYFSQSPKPQQMYIGRQAKTLISTEGGSAEALLQTVNAVLNYTSWCGLTVADDEGTDDADWLSVAAVIEASSLSRILAIITTEPETVNVTSATDLTYKLKAAKYARTFVQYSASSKYAMLSTFGRAFTVNFNGSDTTITLELKQEPGVTYETLATDQVATLGAENCSVFVYYQNDTAIPQQGVMSSDDFFGERHGLDWLQNYIQTNLYNLLYTSMAKVPQTDAGVTRLLSNVEQLVDQSATSGLVAADVWNGGPIGQLDSGNALTKGYYVYAQPISEQAQADREARKVPVIQVACKLTDAVHFANMQINVVR